MKFGLIGEKLSHSFSAEIHTLLGGYDYTLKELKREELSSFFKEREFKGINVTIPYKEEVIPYLDEVTPLAKKLKNVNTIVNDNGKLIGDNTDYYGFAYLLDYYKIDVQDKVVAILGNGGASKTAQVVLEDKGAKEIVVVTRKGTPNFDDVKSRRDVQVIVNATPVGMYPNNGECLINLDDFPMLTGVVDLIYNPYRTELLFRAEERGINNANGLIMLVAQAKKACEQFLGKEIDDSKILSVLRLVRHATENILFIGMPGCGKSTAGKTLAGLLSREFIDTDEEFKKEYGVLAGEYIEKYGERAFRIEEEKIVEKVSKLSRKIIATGGGVVLSEKNRKNIKNNSIVIYLKRKLEYLSKSGRPLSSSNEAIRDLFKARQPLYEKTCDFEVEVHHDKDVTIQRVIKKLEYLGEKYED